MSSSHPLPPLDAYRGLQPAPATAAPAVASPARPSFTSPVIGAAARGFSNEVDTPGTDGSAATPGTDRSRPKQKRNKPTLSCEECVERKTKCDRGRPACLACLKRQSECRYTQVADLIASAKESVGSKARYVTKPPSKIRKTNTNFDGSPASPVNPDAFAKFLPNTPRSGKRASLSSPYLQSNVPFSKSTPSNIFGIGSQFPFSNYWTCQGGVAEVVGVLPSKQQADILMAKYFECVDPVYPFLHRRIVYANYEKFWALPLAEKQKADADLLAVHFTLYALGTQFMQFPAYEERTASAEFYASAATQALRLYSYLNRSSIRSIASMVLLAYFLMNDNHASDAYAWAGILLRQAYAMRLHRDPEIVVPDAPSVEKAVRRKFWQAVFFQDTFLTVLLKLPPTATHSDVSVDALEDESQYHVGDAEDFTGHQSRVENLMSIAVIAPPQDVVPSPPPQPHHFIGVADDKADVEYMKCMWKLGHLVQENLSTPLSLSLPITSSPRQKSSLVASFRSLYRSCPSFLTLLDYGAVQELFKTNPRGARQNLFLTSNYYHCLMLLQASENHKGGVECNVRGALEAAHEAIWAYFKLFALLESDAGVWWVFQHRAFEEALMIADLLSHPPDADTNLNDPLYAKYKDDVLRMLDLIERGRGSPEMKKGRREVLLAACERMLV